MVSEDVKEELEKTCSQRWQTAIPDGATYTTQAIKHMENISVPERVLK